MLIQKTKKGYYNNRLIKFGLGFVLVTIVFVSLFVYSNDKADTAKAEEFKQEVTNSFDVYSNLTDINFGFINDLNDQYSQLNDINAKNANYISNIGNNINNHIKFLKQKKKEIDNSENERIKNLHIRMLNNLLLQELYLNNSIQSISYFNCMVEKKSNFNLIWESFNQNNPKDQNPTLENITSQSSINYFRGYGKAAKDSSESILQFTNCFEDKFYIYKDSQYDELIDSSIKELEYISFTYNKFADLLLGEGNEVELITTIEEIEKFDLSKIIFFNNIFDEDYIIKPSREIFTENVKTSVSESYQEIEKEYKEIINTL